MQNSSNTIKSVLEAYGNEPLYKAIRCRNTRDLFLMLDHGLSPNQIDSDGVTPLHEACLFNNIECAQLLVNYGANVNANTQDVTGYGSHKYYHKHYTPLRCACIAGSVDCVALMIKAGAKLEDNPNDEGSPLHFAVKGNAIECVKLLLQAGASVSVLKNYETSLHRAARYEFFEIAELLIEYGANVFATNFEGKMPIDLVAEKSGRTHDLLKYQASHVVSLKDFCRRKIRCHFESQKMQLIKDLDLPKSLIGYLLHEE